MESHCYDQSICAVNINLKHSGLQLENAVEHHHAQNTFFVVNLKEHHPVDVANHFIKTVNTDSEALLATRKVQ